jgi:hypothetical protein
MQGGYWNAQQDGYGARIHETSSKRCPLIADACRTADRNPLVGNLHDHVINYKSVYSSEIAFFLS